MKTWVDCFFSRNQIPRRISRWTLLFFFFAENTSVWLSQNLALAQSSCENIHHSLNRPRNQQTQDFEEAKRLLEYLNIPYTLGWTPENSPAIRISANAASPPSGSSINPNENSDNQNAHHQNAHHQNGTAEPPYWYRNWLNLQSSTQTQILIGDYPLVRPAKTGGVGGAGFEPKDNTITLHSSILAQDWRGIQARAVQTDPQRNNSPNLVLDGILTHLHLAHELRHLRRLWQFQAHRSSPSNQSMIAAFLNRFFIPTVTIESLIQDLSSRSPGQSAMGLSSETLRGYLENDQLFFEASEFDNYRQDHELILNAIQAANALPSSRAKLNLLAMLQHELNETLRASLAFKAFAKTFADLALASIDSNLARLIQISPLVIPGYQNLLWAELEFSTRFGTFNMAVPTQEPFELQYQNLSVSEENQVRLRVLSFARASLLELQRIARD